MFGFSTETAEETAPATQVHPSSSIQSASPARAAESRGQDASATMGTSGKVRPRPAFAIARSQDTSSMETPASDAS
jgi:hypothetical protein